MIHNCCGCSCDVCKYEHHAGEHTKACNERLMPDPAEKMADGIFHEINESYMVFNKGAEYGINLNTELLIKDRIAKALRKTEAKMWEEAAKLLDDNDDAPHWVADEFRRKAKEIKER